MEWILFSIGKPFKSRRVFLLVFLLCLSESVEDEDSLEESEADEELEETRDALEDSDEDNSPLSSLSTRLDFDLLPGLFPFSIKELD
jgi:hypothetical protein